MCRVIEIIFLIVSIGVVLFGLFCLSSLFMINGLTTTQIIGAIFIGGFFIAVGAGGMSASIYYLRN